MGKNAFVIQHSSFCIPHFPLGLLMPIRKLSTSVVNKIAAGEVIERPASVVKELVENSLDAGATRIDVAVEQGGTDLVRVTDNGSGIPPDELPLAVASHATSKLSSADDLFRVSTLGFRGEALASIAEVSRFSLRSRTGDSPAGAHLEVVAGESSGVEPCGCPPGTAIEVRNLFFNTPVRRKFLRSMQTEMGHLSEAFTRLALAHPEVHFTLRHNDRPVYDLPAAEDWVERIALLAGRDLAKDLIWIESRDEPITLSGYVARPSQSRAHNRMQYLFLNGRHIRDRSLQHALSEAYRGLLLTGRYPISFLRFTMPADLVDVNVHPTKLEVRFQDGGRLYSQLLATLRTKFLTTDLTHAIRADVAEGPAGAHDPQVADRLRSELVDWAKGQMATWSAPATSDARPAAVALAPAGQSRLEFNALPARAAQALDVIANLSPPLPASAASPEQSPALAAARAFDSSSPVRALQIHDRYLVAESEEGVLVIDQHALHERILYEQIRGKVLAGALESQSLLVPDAVDLSAAEAALVSEHRELLGRLGLRIEPFGGDTVLIHSYPAMLGRLKPVEVLRAVVDQLAAGGRAPERRDLLDELLHTVACKAAIKAGDRLSSEEVTALVELRHLAQDTHHCPHGRPTALVFTREELDRQFMRT
jgi:DNA mismatch repair protein MutL